MAVAMFNCVKCGASLAQNVSGPGASMEGTCPHCGQFQFGSAIETELLPPAALTPLLRRMNAESLKLFGNTSQNDSFFFINDDQTSVKENPSVEAVDVRSAFAYGLLEPEDSGADAGGSRLFRLSQLAVTRLQSN
jgi:hypothetical protein